MPRLVRRRPFAERVKAMLNPMDIYLWVSEEIETHELWDSKVIGAQIGLAFNFIFMLARANSGRASREDPVFDEGGGSSAWVGVAINFFVWLLIGASGLNAFFTLTRSRKYRLFEVDVERKPSTPSAQRVRVQSSPAASSPLRLLTDIMSGESAESRAHPDSTRDVWEISVWDPLPVSLQLFCLFGPGHILVYMMFLPLAPLDPTPSMTVFNCIMLQAILSAQLLFFQSRFTQQNKDTSVIQKEVLHEYDTKFVHPRLYPTVRDVGTQFTRDDFGNDDDFVEVGTPTVQLKRGFETRPNPNYAKHIDPDTPGSLRSSNVIHSGLFTPTAVTRQPEQLGSELRSRASSIRPPRRSAPGPTPLSQSMTRPTTSTSTSTNTGSGGYMGVYNHPQSPLKKAPSLGELQFRSPRNNGEMAQLEQYQSFQRDRSSSPMKSARKSTGSSMSAQPSAWGRPTTSSYERYPSMFQ